MDIESMIDRRLRRPGRLASTAANAATAPAAHARRLLAAALFWMLLAGAAQAQTVLYEENFENGPPVSPVLRLTEYTGAPPNNATYTADPQWLRQCNGWVAAWEQSPTEPAPVADCNGQNFWNKVQQLAQVLGVLNGQTTVQARRNTAVSAFTSGNPGPNHIEFESSAISLNLPPGGAGRFVTFGVDVAAASCGPIAHPLMQFYLVGAAGEQKVGSRIDPCDSAQSFGYERRGVSSANNALAGHITAAGAVLYQGGDTLAVRMRNEQGSGAGNDHAFDNFKIVDVTPTLDKSFASPTLAGQPTRLTFTVTNTSEHARKLGWEFTDTLVQGLLIATPNNVSTTCTGTVIDAPAGGSVISITEGNLPEGAASCEIFVDVIAATPGNYTNNQDNINPSLALNVDNVGDTLDVVTNRLTLAKVTREGTGSFALSGNNGIVAQTLTTAAPGTAVSGAAQVLEGTSGTTDTVITETLPAGWVLNAVRCTGLADGVVPTFADTGTATIPFAGLAAQDGGRDVTCTLENALTSDLSIAKQNADPSGGRIERGATTRYTLTVSNAGPGTSTNPVVHDTPGAGLTCAAANPVSCTGPAGACPAGAATVAELTSAAGLTLGSLAAGASVRLQFDCVVQ